MAQTNFYTDVEIKHDDKIEIKYKLLKNNPLYSIDTFTIFIYKDFIMFHRKTKGDIHNVEVRIDYNSNKEYNQPIALNREARMHSILHTEFQIYLIGSDTFIKDYLYKFGLVSKHYKKDLAEFLNKPIPKPIPKTKEQLKLSLSNHLKEIKSIKQQLKDLENDK